MGATLVAIFIASRAGSYIDPVRLNPVEATPVASIIASYAGSYKARRASRIIPALLYSPDFTRNGKNVPTR